MQASSIQPLALAPPPAPMCCSPQVGGPHEGGKTEGLGSVLRDTGVYLYIVRLNQILPANETDALNVSPASSLTSLLP